MEKEKLNKCYEKLNNYFDQYYLHINNYENGKNKTIRGNAERELNYILSYFENYVRAYGEVYMLLMDPENELNNQARTEIFEELRSIRYFGHDMKTILNRIKIMIDQDN